MRERETNKGLEERQTDGRADGWTSEFCGNREEAGKQEGEGIILCFLRTSQARGVRERLNGNGCRSFDIIASIITTGHSHTACLTVSPSLTGKDFLPASSCLTPEQERIV